jgi:hypothetical protein
MYTRLYPTANNTIFQYVSQVLGPNNTYQTVTTSSNINCGANTTMELQDGHGQSTLVFAFTLPTWLQEKLGNYTYTSNLQLFDAGTLFNPPINLKNVTLSSFTQDFVEGDGFSFLPPQNMIGVSNWIQYDSVNLWSSVTFTPITTYAMQRINEDYNFVVTNTIADFLTASINPKFALTITNRTNDPVNVYTKYICSRHTKTVFKPYLEFFIEDSVVDQTFECIAGQVNKIFLLNQNNIAFSSPLTASILYDNETTAAPLVVSQSPGEYYITVTPPLPTTLKTTYATITWSIGSLAVQKQVVKVNTPNRLFEEVALENVFFYPSTPYSHNIVRQGDVVPFTVVSQIRGKGDVVLDTYEYRITSMDGFEMVPWTSTNVYRKKIYFFIHTDYFFPEQQYEVWVRNNTTNFVMTSNLTHKFKVAMCDKSHLRELSASPYYSRYQFLMK